MLVHLIIQSLIVPLQLTLLCIKILLCFIINCSLRLLGNVTTFKCLHCNNPHHSNNYYYYTSGHEVYSTCSCNHGHNHHTGKFGKCTLCKTDSKRIKSGEKFVGTEQVPKYETKLVREGIKGYRTRSEPYTVSEPKYTTVYENVSKTIIEQVWVPSYDGSSGGYYTSQSKVIYDTIPKSVLQYENVTKYRDVNEEYWVSDPVYDQVQVGYETKNIYEPIYITIGGMSKCQKCDCSYCTNKTKCNKCTCQKCNRGPRDYDKNESIGIINNIFSVIQLIVSIPVLGYSIFVLIHVLLNNSDYYLALLVISISNIILAILPVYLIASKICICFIGSLV